MVKPRKHWLHPDMTEKLLTGTLSLTTKTKFLRSSPVQYGCKATDSMIPCSVLHDAAYHEKTRILPMQKTNAQISCAITAQLISAFIFASRIVKSIFFLMPKFQASSLFLWLLRLVCVRADWIPQRPVFSRRGSHKYQLIMIFFFHS